MRIEPGTFMWLAWTFGCIATCVTVGCCHVARPEPVAKTRAANPTTMPSPVAPHSGSKTDELSRAIADEDERQAMSLIQSGIDLNAIGNAVNPPLYYAACLRSMEGVMQAMLDHGAQVNLVGTWGQTALHGAAEDSTPEVVEYLISKGADVSARATGGDTPLFRASARGGEAGDRIMRILLGQGADVNAVDHDGKTSLDYASKLDNPTTAATLRAAGAKLGRELPQAAGRPLTTSSSQR